MQTEGWKVELAGILAEWDDIEAETEEVDAESYVQAVGYAAFLLEDWLEGHPKVKGIERLRRVSQVLEDALELLEGDAVHAEPEDVATAEGLLKVLMNRWPRWLDSGGITATREYRRLLAKGRKLAAGSAKRNALWVVNGDYLVRDFEALRTTVDDQTGA